MRAEFHAALLISALTLTGCRKPAEANQTAEPAPIAVRVARVENRQRPVLEEVVGSVRSKLHAGIEAKVTGKIERMLVVPGQLVKAGELLAELDARDIKAKLDQAMAVRDQTEQEFLRATSLFKDKTISQQEFDLAQSRAKVARASAVEAETMLAYSKIAAPFDGLVTRKLADVGDLATPGKVLLELEDPSTLRLEADVPEALLDRIRLGSKFTVRIPAVTNDLEGVTSEITPMVDAVSRTFLVKLDLAKSEGLRVGQFGRLFVPVAEEAALRAPGSSVAQRGQLEVVFVVVDGRAQLRLVKTGKRIGSEVEIVSGLSADEQVVVENTPILRDGLPVVAQ